MRGDRIIVAVLLLAAKAACVQIVGRADRVPDESELEQLPKLFHLDDYEKCLDKEDGLFCLGQFEVYSDFEDHPTYSLIKKYSHVETLYNRSYLHRGYCVSTRCAGAESNASARFERCVDKWAQYRHGLRARLIRLDYCKEHGKPLPFTPDTQDTPHRIFIYVVLIILTLNIIGTIYDMNVERKEKNDSLIRMWSVVENWNNMTYVPKSEAGNRLDTLDGVKAIFTPGPIYCHASIFITALYQRNPRFMEKYLMTPAGPIIGAFTTLTQMNLAVSTFFTAYVVLRTPSLGIRALPKLILKRLIRLLPVYLLAVGYAATWWSSAGDGPMWHMVVQQSAICRKKFWLMTSFLQNVVDSKNICLIQTWILAVDMQLHIPVLLLALLLRKLQRWAMPVLWTLYLASVALTTYLAFKNSYIPAYAYMTPESYRQFLINSKTFVDFFMSPVNGIMVALNGVMAAYFQKCLRERKVNLDNRKILVFACYTFHLSIYIWSWACYYFREFTDPWLVSAMVPIERMVFGFFILVCAILMLNIQTKVTRFFRWRGMRVIANLSLSLAMVHWCINGILVGNRYTVYDASIQGLVLDSIGTYVLSLVLAVPLTVMVEWPMRKTFEKLLDSI